MHRSKRPDDHQYENRERQQAGDHSRRVDEVVGITGALERDEMSVEEVVGDADAVGERGDAKQARRGEQPQQDRERGGESAQAAPRRRRHDVLSGRRWRPPGRRRRYRRNAGRGRRRREPRGRRTRRRTGGIPAAGRSPTRRFRLRIVVAVAVRRRERRG